MYYKDYKKETTGRNEFMFTTSILDKELFNEALNWYCNDNRSRQYNEGLNLIFDRIDLLERFEV